MAFKMRENKNRDVMCNECKTKWENTPVMYDIMIVNHIYTLCKECSEKLFDKLLKAECNYNHKVKSKEDMKRIQRSYTLKYNGGIEETKPECFGEYLKEGKCYDCKFAYKCKQEYNSQWEDI